MFVSARYMSLYINTMYVKTNTLVHSACPQVYPLLSTNVEVSILHRLIVASLRINQIYIKIDKVQIKPYLHQPKPFHRLNILICGLLPFARAA